MPWRTSSTLCTARKSFSSKGMHLDRRVVGADRDDVLGREPLGGVEADAGLREALSPFCAHHMSR